MAVFLWNRRTKEYLGVYMFRLSCMNIKDGVESLQILDTDAFHGDLDTQRLVVNLLA